MFAMFGKMEYVPCHTMDHVAKGVKSHTCVVPPDTPVYSTYTHDIKGYGQQKYGMLSDDPMSDKEHPAIFHAIVKNNYGEYIIH